MKTKTITISLEIEDILRQTLEEVSTYNPNIEELKKLNTKDEVSHQYLISLCLKNFLAAKEKLVIPDDALVVKAWEVVSKDLLNIDDLWMRKLYKEFFAFQFLDKLGDIARRALKIKEVFTRSHVSEPVKIICREAYLAFIHGYHTASTALCRAIVEAELKNRLNIDFGELGKLNNTAFDKGLYNKKIWHKIDQIRKLGNKFIHKISIGKIPSESENLKILGLTQESLQALVK